MVETWKDFCNFRDKPFQMILQASQSETAAIEECQTSNIKKKPNRLHKAHARFEGAKGAINIQHKHFNGTIDTIRRLVIDYLGKERVLTSFMELQF